MSMSSSASVTAALWDGLPITVEELAVKYRRIRRLNKNLCASINSFRLECNKLADSSPYAAQALQDLLPVVSEVGSSNSSVPTASTATATAVVVRQKKGNRTQSGVLEGVVVKPGKGQHASSNSAVVDSAKSRILRFVEDTKRDYKEEYNVLRLKLLEIESCQQLLVATRQDLEEEKKRCAAFASSLDVCRDELAKSRSQCQFLLNIFREGYNKNKNNDDNDNNSTKKDEVDCFIEDFMVNVKKVDEGSKIKDMQDTLGEEDAFKLSLGVRLVQTEVALQESQSALNSLKSTMEQLSYDNDHLKARFDTLTAERDTLKMQNTQLEGQVQRVLSLVHEDRSTQQDDENIPLRKKRINESQDMTPAHMEMVQELKKLQDENRSLQQNVLQYQRQVNDAELHAEEMADDANKKDEEIQTLKEEVIHLRRVTHDKQIELQQTRHSWQSAAAQWDQLDKVHRTVIEHMSRRLLLHTCISFLPARDVDNSINVVADKRLSTSGDIKVVKDNKIEEAQKSTKTETVMTIEEVPVNLSSDSERVKELLERIESLESEHRSLMKHWQKTNHELRCALASSQEELRQKENHIKVLEQKQDLNKKSVAMFESQSDNECQSKVYSNNKNDSISGNSMHGVSITQECNVEQVLPDKLRLLQEENESLHQQIFDLKERDSTLNALIEDYRKRCETLEQEIKRNAETMTQLVVCGFISPTSTGVRGSSAGTRGSTDAIQIRNLQYMLQCLLKEKMELLSKLKELEAS